MKIKICFLIFIAVIITIFLLVSKNTSNNLNKLNEMAEKETHTNNLSLDNAESKLNETAEKETENNTNNLSSKKVKSKSDELPEKVIYDHMFDREGEYYKVIQIEKNFEVQLLDDDKNIIYSEDFYGKDPDISEIDENILRVFISVGNPDPKYTLYYDTADCRVSETFVNARYIGDGLIYYMEYNDYNDIKASTDKSKGFDGKLIIRDIFSEEEFYMEINRNFAWDPYYAAVVEEVVLDKDKKTLTAKYLTGNFYDNNVVTEEFLYSK